MYRIFIIHCLADEAGCFQFLTVLNRASMSIDEQLSLEQDVEAS